MSKTAQRELAPHTPLNSMQFVLAGESTPANPDVRMRLQEIRNRPVQPTFDPEHLHEIHHRLYGEFNLTAGRLRGTNLLPDGSKIDERTASAARDLADSERKVFDRLTKPSALRGATKDQFVTAMARDFNSLQSENLFNHGSLEAIAVYLGQAAEQAGYSMDLLRGSRSELVPKAGDSKHVYMVGLRKEIYRLATPKSAPEFERVLDLERKGGGVWARNFAVAEHPELSGAFMREAQARHDRERDGQTKSAVSRYERKVKEIQRQLDAGRPPEMPDQRGVEHAQRETRAASM
jgi:fido (protein-threonine AMPylation protein)